MTLTKKAILALGVFGMCYGILFKVQHYPGATVLLIVGLRCIGIKPTLFFHKTIQLG